MNVFVILSSEREFEGLPVRELIAKLEQIGVSASASRKVINDLIDFRYLFTRSHQSVTDDSILFASRFCGYIVRELIGRLMFIETLMFDTFISDDSVWEKIKRNVASIYRDRDPRRRFNTRKEAARQFFNFCEKQNGNFG